MLEQIENWCLDNQDNKSSMDEKMSDICYDMGAFEKLSWFAPESLMSYLLLAGIIVSMFAIPAILIGIEKLIENVKG